MTEERTSSEVASIAARGIVHPEKLTMDEIQTVCASALTQVDSRPNAQQLQQGDDDHQGGDDADDDLDRLGHGDQGGQQVPDQTDDGDEHQ